MVVIMLIKSRNYWFKFVLDSGYSGIFTQSRTIYLRADTNGVVYSLDNQTVIKLSCYNRELAKI